VPLLTGASAHPSNTWFIRSTQLSVPNGILIGSAVFVQLKPEGPYACSTAMRHDDDDGLSLRHDGSLVTDNEDEFGGVSRDQSEKHRCGHT